MKEALDNIITFFFSLFINHPEGMFLYTGGTLTLILVNLYYRKEWDIGSKGINHLWDLPEQLAVIFGRWVLPQMVIASYCLPKVVEVHVNAWWTVIGIIFFCLTGRWGLEWLGRVKGGGSITSFTEITKEKETTAKVTTDDSIQQSGTPN